jgi:hypothetical protein
MLATLTRTQPSIIRFSSLLSAIILYTSFVLMLASRRAASRTDTHSTGDAKPGWSKPRA